jgi:hypothetical protein
MEKKEKEGKEDHINFENPMEARHQQDMDTNDVLETNG